MNITSLHVLLIEDDAEDSLLIERLLHRYPLVTITTQRVSSLQEAIQTIQQGDFDAALLDLGLPDSQGMDSLRQLHACDARLPIVVLSGVDDHAIALEAVASGAQDFISKHALSGGMLPRALFFAQKRQAKLLGLEAAADVDPLTGLKNRRNLQKAFLDLHTQDSSHVPLSAALLDVDHFKAVNDRYGHLAGDEVLRQLSQSMRNTAESPHQVFRYGGEEFVFLLQDPLAAAEQRIGELLQTIEDRSIHVREQILHVTVSAGITQVRDGDSFDAALLRADQALYRAKADGRNRLVSN
ncbi:GGDEF domain-containing protein [Aureliella helgolandensis]|uniref:diguanylate cyclase n=1 Tax=Aureliella helgolandensis TaxID=2527968 RepID=A0A518G2Z9_9BACT|nr:diguanylate cyclase [Aureliella helgolandensis]QDV22976.1 Diguanylate cyclase YdeH [Aureliella helgolandensis]